MFYSLSHSLGVTSVMGGTNINLVTHGDSITADLAGENYSLKLQTLLGSSLTQVGTNGSSYDYEWTDPSAPGLTTMIEEASSLIDSEIIPGKTNILVVFAGINGFVLAGHSAATEYADFDTYITARIVAGWLPENIYVVDMLPRTGVVYSVNQEFNGLLSTGRITHGYKMVRLRYLEIGASGANLDTDWFYDGTHPTALGHTAIAQEIYDTIYPASISDTSLAVLELTGETSGFAIFAEDDSCMVKDASVPNRNFRGLASTYFPFLTRSLDPDTGTYRFRVTAADNFRCPLSDMVWNDPASTVFTKFQAESFPNTRFHPVATSINTGNLPSNSSYITASGTAIFNTPGTIFMVNATYTGASTATHRMALRLETNNAGVSFDGNTVNTDVSCTMVTGLDQFLFGQGPNGADKGDGWIDCIVVLPRAATDIELLAWNP